jgi:hypothetical protein
MPNESSAGLIGPRYHAPSCPTTPKTRSSMPAG